MPETYINYFDSPIGLLKIIASENALLSVEFRARMEEEIYTNSITEKTKLQLTEYFNQERKKFDIVLGPIGTAFQKKVWSLLQTIEFGKTTTYQKQAIQLGDVKAIRAMASANGKNPIAIIIPCHRVIGSDGSLTGYAGGLIRKQQLLELEAKAIGSWNQLF